MGKKEVFVQGEGFKKIELVRVEKGNSIRDLLEAAASIGLILKGEVDRLAVFLEDSDKELDANMDLDIAGIKGHTHIHIHRCRKVQVIVNFNGRHIESQFPPSTTISRVKKWAVGTAGFNLTEIDASEHALQICGSSDRPDEDVHIGTLVSFPECKVCFDLVAKIRVEG